MMRNEEEIVFGSPEHIQELEERIEDLKKWRDSQKRGSAHRQNYSNIINTVRSELKSAQRAASKLDNNTPEGNISESMFTFDKFIDDIVIRENSKNKIMTYNDSPARERAKAHQEKPGNRIKFR